MSIISSGEGLRSATTLLKSRVNYSQLPSDSFFVHTYLHYARREKERRRSLKRERGIWSWDSSSFSQFTSVQHSCQDPGTGSQSQTIPAKWLRGAKFLTRCVETKQRLNLEIKRELARLFQLCVSRDIISPTITPVNRSLLPVVIYDRVKMTAC